MTSPRPASTVVIVTYESASVIERCVESVLADLGPAVLTGDAEVVVVDNGSTDGTTRLVESRFPQVRVVHAATNGGYAAGINLGIRSAPPRDAVLVLNPDLVVEPGAVAALTDAATGRIGITVPTVLDPDGTVARSIRREPSAVRTAAEAVLGGPLAARVGLGETETSDASYAHGHPIEWATGAALLITRPCLEEVGPLDESFFLYSEETDLMLRARDAGWVVAFVPAAVVVHRGGDMATSAPLWSMRTVNRVRLQRRRHGRTSTALFLAAALVGEGIRALAGRRVARHAFVALCRQGPAVVAGPPPPRRPASWAPTPWPASPSEPCSEPEPTRELVRGSR